MPLLSHVNTRSDTQLFEVFQALSPSNLQTRFEASQMFRSHSGTKEPARASSEIEFSLSFPDQTNQHSPSVVTRSVSPLPSILIVRENMSSPQVNRSSSPALSEGHIAALGLHLDAEFGLKSSSPSPSLYHHSQESSDGAHSQRSCSPTKISFDPSAKQHDRTTLLDFRRKDRSLISDFRPSSQSISPRLPNLNLNPSPHCSLRKRLNGSGSSTSLDRNHELDRTCGNQEEKVKVPALFPDPQGRAEQKEMLQEQADEHERNQGDVEGEVQLKRLEALESLCRQEKQQQQGQATGGMEVTGFDSTNGPMKDGPLHLSKKRSSLLAPRRSVALWRKRAARSSTMDPHQITEEASTLTNIWVHPPSTLSDVGARESTEKEAKRRLEHDVLAKGPRASRTNRWSSLFKVIVGKSDSYPASIPSTASDPAILPAETGTASAKRRSGIKSWGLFHSCPSFNEVLREEYRASQSPGSVGSQSQDADAQHHQFLSGETLLEGKQAGSQAQETSLHGRRDPRPNDRNDRPATKSVPGIRSFLKHNSTKASTLSRSKTFVIPSNRLPTSQSLNRIPVRPPALIITSNKRHSAHVLGSPTSETSSSSGKSRWKLRMPDLGPTSPLI